MWYWGSSDIDTKFLSPRELDKPYRPDKICFSGNKPYPYDNSGKFNIYDWQDLLNAGFPFPNDNLTSLLYPQTDMKYCMFMRQFSHSIIECSKGNFKLKQPYDCREVTTDFRVALFFACQTKKDRNKYGKIIVFTPFDKEFKGIKCLDSANLEFEFPNVYPSECDYYRRAKRQSAVLLQNTLGANGSMKHMNERILLTISIPSKIKKQLLNTINSDGINFDYLFPPLMACHTEQATASGTLLDYVWSELEQKREQINKYHDEKGDVNWIYDEPF